MFKFKKWIFVSLAFMMICSPLSAATSLIDQLQQIEKKYNGRVGLYVLNTKNNQQIEYRANERFPMGCTSKVIGVAAVLYQSMKNPSLLIKQISYNKDVLTNWSPITEKYVDRNISIKDLCQAAIGYSDNTAMNLLVKELGGLKSINAFARKLGDDAFRQDNIWPDEAKSGGNNPQDSSTPANMAASLKRLLLGHSLDDQQKHLLKTWMLNNTTGNKRIRAGVPKDWAVAEKTGTGSYFGTTNDIGVIYPKKCSPIIIAVYYTGNEKELKPKDTIVATVTRLAIQSLATQDTCLNKAYGLIQEEIQSASINVWIKRCIV